MNKKDFSNRTVVPPPRMKPQEGKVAHVEEEWRKARVKSWADSAMRKLPKIRPAPKRLPPRRRPVVRTGGLLDSRPAVKKQTHPRGLLNLKRA